MKVPDADQRIAKASSNGAKDILATGRESAALGWWFVGMAIAAGLLCPIAFQFDNSIVGNLDGWDVPGDLKKAIQLSEAFAHGVGATFILLSVFVVVVDRRRAVVVAIMITALSGILANVLKTTVVRVRPYAAGLQVKDHVGSIPANNATEAITDELALIVERSIWDTRQRSFPSGHSATACGLAIGLSLLFPRAWWIFAVLATFACFQRLESGAHFLSDVFAGAGIAFLVAACTLFISRTRTMSGLPSQPLDS